MTETFFFFAYDALMSRTALEAAAGAAPLRSRPASIRGHRLALSAVSAASPRLALLSVQPLLALKDDAAAAPAAARAAVPLLEGVAPGGAVWGVRHELPAAARRALLQAVGRMGSYHLMATLPCTPLDDSSAGEEAEAEEEEALVITAMDLPLLHARYKTESLTRWAPLPPLDALNGGTVASGEAVGTQRWPGTHWCNCAASDRLAPTAEYLAAVRVSFAEAGLLQRGKAQAGGGSYLDVYRGLYEAGPWDHDPKHCAAGRVSRPLVRDPSGPAEARVWYLAYGSNLSWTQVCLRIGPPYQRRPVRVDGYVLVANANDAKSTPPYHTVGYYNIETVEARHRKEEKGLVVHASAMPPYVCGAAYEIATDQLHLMDLFETGYTRVLLPGTDLWDEAVRECWAYSATHTSEEALPTKEYVARVLEGRDILPTEYIDCIERTPRNPLRSPRQDRRLRKEL